MPHRQINGYVFVAFWMVFFGLLVYLFYRWHHLNVGGLEETVVNKQLKKLVIRVDSSNYYRVDGSLNDVPVNFVIDTGANKVAIPKGIADKAGLRPIREISVKTANGETIGHLTRIPKLTIGPMVLTNVPGIIMKDNSELILLGMSALKRLELHQRDNYMVLIQRAHTQ